MYAVFVRSTRKEPYAELICSGAKTIETRNRDTLGKLVGKRVGIIRTRSGHPAELIGSVVIGWKLFRDAENLDWVRHSTRIPVGSKYENPNGKWTYMLSDPRTLSQPIPLANLPQGKRNRSYLELFPTLK